MKSREEGEATIGEIRGELQPLLHSPDLRVRGQAERTEATLDDMAIPDGTHRDDFLLDRDSVNIFRGLIHDLLYQQNENSDSAESVQ